MIDDRGCRRIVDFHEQGCTGDRFCSVGGPRSNHKEGCWSNRSVVGWGRRGIIGDVVEGCAGRRRVPRGRHCITHSS